MAQVIDHDIQDTINRTLELSKNMGAEESEIVISSSESFSIKTEDQTVSEYKVTDARVLGVRVFKDNRVGISYTEDLSTSALEFTIKAALDQAVVTKEDPHQKLSAEKSQSFHEARKEYLIDDPTTTEEKIAFALDLEKQMKGSNSKVRNCPYNGYGDSTSSTVLANSKGLLSSWKERSCSCYTSGLFEDNGKESMYYEYSIGRQVSDLEPEKIVKEVEVIGADLLKGEALSTGDYDIIFSPSLLSSFLGTFTHLYSAKSALENLNPWKEKRGTSVAAKAFTLRDLPHYRDAFTQTPFDDEGFPVRDLTLIEQGVLQNFWHNSSTANEMNEKNNFHASRGARGPLSVGPHLLVVDPGKNTEDQVKDGDYFEIVSLQGLGSGSDPMSGQFSFGASGYLKNGDEIKQVVRGVTVSGNFFDVLRNIKQMGNQTRTDSQRSMFAPMIRFGGMRVGGK